MDPLPIDESLPEILDALGRHRRLVLVAPPGAGKTTRLPPAVVRSGLLPASHPGIIVLQPRRVAARSTAARIGEEQGWALGEEVGYQVRLDRRVSARTRLIVETEGILNRQVLADPFLEGIGAVVLDEFHERSIHSDLALALLKEIRREVRPDLLLVVMSATLDAGPVASFLDDAPLVRVEGRAFPVEVEYRPSDRPASPEAVTPAIRDALGPAADRGHVLVFLPGMAEIRRVRAAAEPIVREAGAVLHVLHSSIPAEDQDRALRPSAARKVILATNIAETSLTIEGVTTVIDSGLARVAHHDSRRGFDRLELSRISVASATQRAGRAGRTAPGRCIRLWSPREDRGMEPFDRPEVHRVDLCSTVLTLHSWGVSDPSGFGWYDPPAADRLDAADRLLTMLGAVEAGRGTVTGLGRRMLDLPVHPRLARLLIASAAEGRAAEGATIAALLSEKDVVERGGATGPSAGPPRATQGRGASDLLGRMALLEEAERGRFGAGLRDRGIDAAAARQVARIRDDLIRLARRLGSGGGSPPTPGDEAESPLRWLLLAYPDRVVRRRGAEETGVMVGGRGVRLDRSSVVRDGELFLALDPRQERRRGTLELLVRLASLIRPEWLEELLPGLLRREVATRYDEERERVVGVTRLWYQDLLLKEDASRSIPAEEAAGVLASALRPRAAALFREDPAAAAWLARFALVREAVTELDWPEIGDDRLAEGLEALCRGKTRAEEVRQADKIGFLDGLLSYPLRRELAEGAPRTLTVPSGRQIALHYEPGAPPVLAVRLQELFGWTETPRLARGRVPVLLHLLGPNHRPVQITADLRSFWATTYHQVRKDLRARYPKHSWPEDPLKAEAIAGPRRRST
ncbi:ATP-dependent RNA helicase HrpB [Aquisphaera giovannonii]|uniref:ATP-dependent RNA helicase HrpB n=1 Tax=Aquisphaera giovannonii TaxID=406548 RepID=A0A5B9WCT7_9BACT|nr:ATP-dependent helicase HrpB [Aquisphaera giovannonii]QEH37875.1 ATP-dependent RNA helicase HrpB [Aquisphaera giovannonii]